MININSKSYFIDNENRLKVYLWILENSNYVKAESPLKLFPGSYYSFKLVDNDLKDVWVLSIMDREGYEGETLQMFFNENDYKLTKLHLETVVNSHCMN